MLAALSADPARPGPSGGFQSTPSPSASTTDAAARPGAIRCSARSRTPRRSRACSTSCHRNSARALVGTKGGLADHEYRHDRLSFDRTPACGCWSEEGAAVLALPPVDTGSSSGRCAHDHQFCFAQNAKPGPRRKEIGASLLSTSRSISQLRGALFRIAQVALQIVACYERFGPDERCGFADPSGWKGSGR
jgi:hypothetical protein